MGRRAVPHVPESFTFEAFRGWTDRSRRNLGVDRLDLVQLHCPPTAVYSDDRVYDALDTLVDEGAIAAYGVSVETTFAAGDHRTYNRAGEAFDVGETFAGVPFEVGVRAARRVSQIAAPLPAAQVALRWILDQPGVSTVIPGARNEGQVRGNVAAASLDPLPADVLDGLRAVYDEEIRQHVHDRW